MLEVSRVFNGIKDFLGLELFKETFEVIITDNGSEFHDPLSIETDSGTGERLVDVYFCRPRHSEDKAKCEKNHEHFREMVPKGMSMNPLSRKDIRYVSNNVNNYPRKKYNYNSPYEMSQNFLNEKVFKLNNLGNIV
jgi:IS30 family transposase